MSCDSFLIRMTLWRICSMTLFLPDQNSAGYSLSLCRTGAARFRRWFCDHHSPGLPLGHRLQCGTDRNCRQCLAAWNRGADA